MVQLNIYHFTHLLSVQVRTDLFLSPTCSKRSSWKGLRRVDGEGPSEFNSRAAPPTQLTPHPAKHVFVTEGDKWATRSAQNKQEGVHRLDGFRKRKWGCVWKEKGWMEVSPNFNSVPHPYQRLSLLWGWGCLPLLLKVRSRFPLWFWVRGKRLAQFMPNWPKCIAPNLRKAFYSFLLVQL